MIMRRDLLILLILLGVVGLLPIFLHNNMPIMGLLTMCLIWAVVASAWDLILGYAGLFSFAQVAFFCIGAYGSAMLTIQWGISPWLGMLAGGAMTTVVGVIICLPCLRLKGSYLALLTIAIHMLLRSFLVSDLGRAIGTGGSTGLFRMPALAIGGYTFSPFEPLPWFYTALVICFLSLFVIYRIIHSSWGMAFVALRDNEAFAKSLGVNDFRYKVLLFGVSAFLTGVIGAFYAHYTAAVSPRILGLDLMVMLVVMQVVGGMGIFPGAAIGSFVITFLNEYLRAVDIYRLVILGAVVILLVIYLPRGIMGALFPVKGSGYLERFSYSVWRTLRKQFAKGKYSER